MLSLVRHFFYLRLLVLAIDFLVWPSLAFATNLPRLSEREILQRCYTQLTGHRLGSGSDLWSKVKSQSAPSICMNLLNNVKLTAEGSLVEGGTEVHRSILKQFLDFHRTWFEQQWAFQNSFPDDFWGGVDIYDPQEPALFLTRNLVMGENYSRVLTGSETAVALRDGSKLATQLPATASGFLRVSRSTYNSTEGSRLNSNSITFSSAASYNESTIQTLATPLVQMGDLYGIKLQSYAGAPLLPVVWTEVYSTAPTASTPGVSVPQAFMANRGGGALGSVPYIMMNIGHGFDYKADGADKLPRRYILSVFQNYLCRQGPFVRASDVAPWKTTIAAAPAFRKSDACIRCHATLDQAAMVLRNIRLGGVVNMRGDNMFLDFRTPAILVNYNVDQSLQTPEFWPSVSESNFYRTRPDGKLYFRSINGQIVDVPLNSLENLGQALTNTADYYACAAKRYFEYFTKNKVDLYDPYDPSNSILNEGLTEKEREMREFVFSLGQELHSGGNLKKLVRRILESDYYSSGNFGK